MAGRAPAASAPSPISRRDRFAVVAARFNKAISEKLLDGALAAFATHGVSAEAVHVHRVPGSFELPQAALALARTGRYAGIVCVGVVIKGETPHFDYVAGVAAHGIGRASLDTGIPMSFGVITSLDEDQAWARAGGAAGNRGEDAARATLEMVAWLRGIRSGRRAPASAKRAAEGRPRGRSGARLGA